MQPQSNRSWYGGSWPRGSKATPVTQIARESIAAATGVASDLVATAHTNVPRNGPASIRSPSLYLSRSKGSSSRSLPLAATTTKLNITSNTSDILTDNAPNDQTPTNVEGAHHEQRRQIDLDKNQLVENAVAKIDGQNGSESKELPPNSFHSMDESISEEKSADVSSRWLGWFSKPANQTTQSTVTGQSIVANGQTSRAEALDLSSQSLASQTALVSQGLERDLDPNSVTTGSKRNLQPRSWLGLWGNIELPAEKSTLSEVTGVPSQLSHNNTKVQNPTGNPGHDNQLPLMTSQAPAQVSETQKPTGWAFWSRENSKDEGSGSKESFGKLALASSPSQSHPESAVINEAQGILSKLGKSERSKSVGKVEGSILVKVGDDTGRKSEALSAKSKSVDHAQPKRKTNPANLVLPSLARTYRAAEKPGVFQQLSRFLQFNRLPDTKHVSIVQDPPRIKRALAIVRSLE